MPLTQRGRLIQGESFIVWENCVTPSFLEPCAASEGGGFTVTVPALPGIVTQGEDVEDALAMARDAIELSLSVRRDEGDEIPPSDAEYARLEIVAVSVPAA
ncbi:MAG: type II toxin-antitoxin system HicB family antitoxin [Candidatus Eremiobacteraeota bacterium]|nr:type II toxin-antitoxin system HicB family antitoxin [Candidatus Eremiobacteraeota bacterium]